MHKNIPLLDVFSLSLLEGEIDLLLLGDMSFIVIGDICGWGDNDVSFVIGDMSFVIGDICVPSDNCPPFEPVQFILQT